MKIISKYKDYYDYLVGIYGEDPKLVLDRRVCDPTPSIYDNQKFSLYIGGYRIDGIYTDDTFYYGEDLTTLDHRKKGMVHYIEEKDFDRENLVFIKTGRMGTSTPFSTVLLKDRGSYNVLKNCPILFKQFSKISNFPILSLLNLPKFLSSEKIFLILSEWLSEQITESEKLIDKRNDILKLESKGFDKKTSFRPNIKN